MVTVDFWSETAITGMLPSLGPGVYEWEINMGDDGYAYVPK